MHSKKSTRSQKQDQATRFIEAAKKTGADESGKTFEKAFRKVVKAEKPPNKKEQ